MTSFDYAYDKDAQYQLTPAQLADGWMVEFTHYSVTYSYSGNLQNPNPDTPAHKQWYKNGQLAAVRHFQNGVIHDPSPNVPSYQSWGYGEALVPKFNIHYCRDVEIPPEFWQWTIKDALNTNNLEQRRVWFEENGGWEELERQFDLLDEQPDPANDSFTLRLCEFPAHLDVYENQARIIFCNNASLDLDGSRRRYALIAPIEWGDNALSVMAQSFGLTAKEYATLKVAK